MRLSSFIRKHSMRRSEMTGAIRMAAVEGQILAISEADDKVLMGNNMQFCLHFNEDERNKVDRAYDVLREDAQIICDLGEPSWSPYMFALVDRFGVHWCIFI